MENTHSDSLNYSEYSFASRLHRRSHLKSETYRTLVQILSHCSDESLCSSTVTAIVHQDPNSENSTKDLEQGSENELCAQNEPDSDRTMPENLLVLKDKVNSKNEAIGFGDMEVDDMQMPNDEIGHIMVPQENEYFSKQKELLVCENTEPNGFQNGTLHTEQMIIDELARILEGSEEFSQNNSLNLSATPLDNTELERLLEGHEVFSQKNSVNLSATSLDNMEGIVASINNQREQVEPQHIIIEEQFATAEYLQIDKEENIERSRDARGPSLDIDMISETVKPIENTECQGSFLKTDTFHEEHEIQHKMIELKESIYTSGTVNLDVHPTDDKETEDREIFGALTSDDKSTDVVCEDSIVPKGVEKTEERKFSGDLASDEKSTDKVCADSIVSEGTETEEGEISGDLGSDDKSTYMVCDDVALSKEKALEKISHSLIDRLGISSSEHNRSNRTHSNSSSFVLEDGPDMKLEGSVTNMLISRPGVIVSGTPSEVRNVHGYDYSLEAGRNEKNIARTKEVFDHPAACASNLVFYGDIFEGNAIADKGITSTEKDSGIFNKKKRAPPTKERRKKKKIKDRKKRAEKNRQLGVKRLKLQPVLKEKPIANCRHYMMGRCHEGANCKFSHDAIPLTKSMPCGHFARSSCMKGDDCPFDHQLSKYPCNSYASKGFCSRGDDCMFSHKIPLEEASGKALDTCDSSSLRDKPNPTKQSNNIGPSHQNINSLSNLLGKYSSKKTEQNLAGTISNLPELAPKGISFLSAGKTSKSNILKQSGSSPKRVDNVVGNQTDQSASSTAPDVNKFENATPSKVIPQGINFLAYGKASYGVSSNTRVDYLPSGKDEVGKLSALENNGKRKQVFSSGDINEGIKVGKQISPKEVQKPNEIMKKTQSEASPPGVKFMPFGKSSVDDSRSNKQTTLPSSMENVINRSGQSTHDTSLGPQWSSAFSRRLPASSFSPGQSLDRSSLGRNKSSPDTAKKALLSTLAFAANWGSGLKMNRPIGGLATTEANNVTKINSNAGSSTNDLAKASRILDFLSGGGSNGKSK